MTASSLGSEKLPKTPTHFRIPAILPYAANPFRPREMTCGICRVLVCYHFARKIDTRLAPPLRNTVNQGNDPSLAPDIKAILRRLARRNLLRGYHLSIPTGQSVAAAMGVTPLSENELRLGNSGPLNQVLEDNGGHMREIHSVGPDCGLWRSESMLSNLVPKIAGTVQRGHDLPP
jgi:hypothetical protein